MSERHPEPSRAPREVLARIAVILRHEFDRVDSAQGGKPKRKRARKQAP